MLTASLAVLLHCTAPPPVRQQQTPPQRTAVSESANDTLRITGTVTREGVECPAVRGDDGKLYTIIGAGREKLTPGARVRITGTVAQMSTCMQGMTIFATGIEILK